MSDGAAGMHDDEWAARERAAGARNELKDIVRVAREQSILMERNRAALSGEADLASRVRKESDRLGRRQRKRMEEDLYEEPVLLQGRGQLSDPKFKAGMGVLPGLRDDIAKVLDGAKTDLPNPKDLLGVKKPPTLSVIPSTALVHFGQAMQNGAEKYGAFNWREHAVESDVYVDAAMRHIMAWQDCEEFAEDSGVHHLGHAMACLGILLDAQETGNLLDLRMEGPAPALIRRFTKED